MFQNTGSSILITGIKFTLACAGTIISDIEAELILAILNAAASCADQNA